MNNEFCGHVGCENRPMMELRRQDPTTGLTWNYCEEHGDEAQEAWSYTREAWETAAKK